MSTMPLPSTAGARLGDLASIAVQGFDDLYRWTVDEYEQLADNGVLKDRHVELINGWLVRKMTTRPPHVLAVDATRQAIAPLLPHGWWLREEKPIRIPDFDEPEPDLSVVRGTRLDYRSRHPEPGEIVFLVEVSDTSLPWDRGQKKSAYARAAVPTYWIINLVDRQLEVYSDPVRGEYQNQQVLGPDGSVPVVIDGVEIGVVSIRDLFC